MSGTVAPETHDPLFPPAETASAIGWSDADLAAELACVADAPDSVADCLKIVQADRAGAYADVQAHWLSDAGEYRETEGE